MFAGKNRRYRPWLALVAALALGTTACSGEPLLGSDDPDEIGPDPDIELPEGEPLKVGLVTTLSGSVALFGVANQKGAQLAVDELNRAGGVLGRPVELIVRDEQGRPEEGVAQTRDLILTEEIDVLLGPVSSGVALAMTEEAREREVPFIVHTSNTEALMTEEYHPYLVSVVPNTGMEARAQGVDLAEREFTRWATIAPDYEFGQRQTGTFTDTLTSLNPDVEIVEQQWPELGETDFDPFITSVLSQRPDAVYSPLFGTDLVSFTRQANDLGLFEQTYFTALYETDALQELGDEVDLAGVRAYSRCPFTIDTPQMSEFVTRYTDRFGEVPSDWACMAYDAVNLWGQVVESIDTADPAAFSEAVGGFEFTSLRGDTYIRDVDHQAAVGSYFSDLAFDEERGFYVYERAEPVPAEDIWLSEAEVEAARDS